MDVFRQMIEIRNQLLRIVRRAGYLGMTAAGNFAGGDWVNSLRQAVYLPDRFTSIG